MNLRTVSQRLIDCKSCRNPTEAISQSLHFNFLEKKVKIKKLAEVKELAGQNANPVSAINNYVDTKAVFISGDDGQFHAHSIDLETGVVETHSIQFPKQAFDFRHFGGVLFFFSPTEVSVAENGKSVSSVKMPQIVDMLLASAFDSSVFRFLLVSPTHDLILVTVNRNESTSKTDLIQVPDQVYKAKIVQDKIYVCTYLNRICLIENGSQTQISLPLGESTINDFHVDWPSGNLITLTNNNVISVFDSDRRLKSTRKIEGIFSEIGSARGFLILTDLLPGSPKLILKMESAEKLKLSEILLINEEIVALEEGNKVTIFDPASCKLSHISWLSKSVGTSKEFLRFVDPGAVRAITNPNIQEFFVWRDPELDKIFNIFVQFESKECLIFRGNMAGLCRVEPLLGSSLFCPKDLDIRILGYFRHKDNDLIVYQYQEEWKYQVHFLNPNTQKNIKLFESAVEPKKAIFMPKIGLLLIVVDNKIQVLAERNGPFKGVKVIDFQGPLSSIDCNGDLLMATSLTGGVHLYKFTVKDTDIKVVYFAGDKKNRRVTFGAFYGEKSVYYVLENGKTLLLSADPEKVYKWSKTGAIFEQVTSMVGFEEVVQPLVKISQDGAGSFFQKATEAQIELLKEGRRLLEHADPAHTGLLFDSTGGVDLITKTKPDFLKVITDNIESKSTSKLTNVEAASALLQISGALSQFVGEDLIDLNELDAQFIGAPESHPALSKLCANSPSMTDILAEVHSLLT